MQGPVIHQVAGDEVPCASGTWSQENPGAADRCQTPTVERKNDLTSARVAIPATCVLPFVLCGLLPHSRSKFLAEYGRRRFPSTKKEVLGSGREITAEKVLADAITIDGRKEWICKFCSETNVGTQWRVRRCFSNIPAGLQGPHKQAIFAKNKDGISGSSSSGGKEERKPRDQEEELEKLRAQVELLSSKEWRRAWRRRVSRREEEVVLKKTARWRLRKKRTTRKN